MLTSPKLTESEVEAFAKMGNVSEDVLRIIGTNRGWLKNYGIVLAVTKNPKTPPAISMQLMHRLTEKDIKMLTTDRNVPEALRLAARQGPDEGKHEVGRSASQLRASLARSTSRLPETPCASRPGPPCRPWRVRVPPRSPIDFSRSMARSKSRRIVAGLVSK